MDIQLTTTDDFSIDSCVKVQLAKLMVSLTQKNASDTIILLPHSQRDRTSLFKTRRRMVSKWHRRRRRWPCGGPTITWEQIAIHYRWQLVIYDPQKNRLDQDINRGGGAVAMEDKMPHSSRRAARSVPSRKHTVIISWIVQIIIRLVCQVGGNLSKVFYDEDLTLLWFYSINF